MALFQDPSSRWCLLAPMTYSVLLLVYVILQFIAFFFVLVATPIEVLVERNPLLGGVLACFTLWGYKLRCHSLDYVFTIDQEFSDCPVVIHRFRAAQAFAIISIFVYGAAFILGSILLYGCSFLRWVCLALNIVGIATLCVVWAAMAVTYNKEEGRFCPAIKDDGTYAAGFVLFVIAWILDIINTFMLLLPCTVPATKPPEKVESPTAEE
ncbi:uncharacterized protein [Leishmania mexicana MHOM/GT/2001/U1103]|uniref:Amastin-like surface protein n=1 Tax=Leishmania mexicana (strain MHOM/GT/2001/U1103) TaxID=929439 RepID=E8NHE0_LEIMU|nr:uncharacterized protein [Leishmania mexicana MHOM/GT/2001/U1103]CBZ40913.1 unnamed protein product [Leishmania mexicana MHOM/GT/2001/U1103]